VGALFMPFELTVPMAGRLTDGDSQRRRYGLEAGELAAAMGARDDSVSLQG
jgi:hypothetical protein